MPAVEPTPTPVSLLHRLARLGAAADWAAFVARYAPLVADRCRAAGLQPADADDIRAEVFARLVTALRGFDYDPGRTFRGYLRAAVDNAIRSHWRTLARRPGWVAAGGLPDLPDPLAGLGDELGGAIEDRASAAAEAVERARAGVEPHTWQAFWLTAIEDRPAAEAADRLGMTSAAVYMAKSRVLRLLRESLGEGGGNNGTPG
ncbi:MAG: sigma-70 family RNA polymerase sigma factor [Gemmataceae bacterium]|nr:sigma-70 family RNA polymerase sigma factor [Gemmataceae bacterium]